jgi:hypothetical protein
MTDKTEGLHIYGWISRNAGLYHRNPGPELCAIPLVSLADAQADVAAERERCVKITEELSKRLMGRIDAQNSEITDLEAALRQALSALERMRRWAEHDVVNYTGDHPVALAREAITNLKEALK